MSSTENQYGPDRDRVQNLLNYINGIAYLQKEVQKDGLVEVEQALQKCIDILYSLIRAN